MTVTEIECKKNSIAKITLSSTNTEPDYISISDEENMPLIPDEIYCLQSILTLHIYVTTAKIFLHHQYELSVTIESLDIPRNTSPAQLLLCPKHYYLANVLYPHLYLDLNGFEDNINVLGCPNEMQLQKLEEQYKNVSVFLDENDTRNLNIDVEQYKHITFYSTILDDRFEQKFLEIPCYESVANHNYLKIPFIIENENREGYEKLNARKYELISIKQLNLRQLPKNIVVSDEIYKYSYLIKYLGNYNFINYSDIRSDELAPLVIVHNNFNNVKYAGVSAHIYCSENAKEYCRNFITNNLNSSKINVTRANNLGELCFEADKPSINLIITDTLDISKSIDEADAKVKCPTYLFYLNYPDTRSKQIFTHIKNIKASVYGDNLIIEDFMPQLLQKDEVINGDTYLYISSSVVESLPEDWILKSVDMGIIEQKNLLTTHNIKGVILQDWKNMFFTFSYCVANNIPCIVSDSFPFSHLIKPYFVEKNFDNVLIYKKVTFAAKNGSSIFVDDDKKQKGGTMQMIKADFGTHYQNDLETLASEKFAIKYTTSAPKLQQQHDMKENWVCVNSNKLELDSSYLMQLIMHDSQTHKFKIIETTHEFNRYKFEEYLVSLKNCDINVVPKIEIKELPSKREGIVKNIINKIGEMEVLKDQPNKMDSVVATFHKIVKQLPFEVIGPFVEYFSYHISMHGHKYIVLKDYLDKLCKIFEKNKLMRGAENMKKLKELTQLIMHNKHQNLIKSKKPCLYLSTLIYTLDYEKLTALLMTLFIPIYRYTYDEKILQITTAALNDIFNMRHIIFDARVGSEIDVHLLRNFIGFCHNISGELTNVNIKFVFNSVDNYEDITEHREMIVTEEPQLCSLKIKLSDELVRNTVGQLEKYNEHAFYDIHHVLKTMISPATNITKILHERSNVSGALVQIFLDIIQKDINGREGMNKLLTAKVGKRAKNMKEKENEVDNDVEKVENVKGLEKIFQTFIDTSSASDEDDGDDNKQSQQPKNKLFEI